MRPAVFDLVHSFFDPMRLFTSKALRTSRWRMLRFLTVLAVFACHSDAITTNPLNVRVVLVNLTSAQLRVGQRTQATATAMDSSGATVRGVPIKWASSNTSVASINDTTATVTALSAGSTTISASTEGVTGAVGVVVLDAPPPVATKLAITTPPASSATSGQALAQQPVIQLQDANGNAVSHSGVVARVAMASGGGTLSGTTTATTDANGIATFSNLTITGSGAQTLQFTAPNLTGVTSSAVNVSVTPPVATKLAITTQPSGSATSGQPLAMQPVVQLQDANSNAVSQSGVVVTASIASGGGTLSGTTTATTNANGTATFSNLTITGSGAQTLQFSAPNLSAATSSGITLTMPPPVATQLAITTQPSTSATSGQVVAQQPVIQLQDANSNAVGQSGVVVTVAIATGGGTLSGPTTATTHITTASPRPPNRRAIRHVMRKRKPHGIIPIHMSVRKYGSQVITKCHHPAFSPMAIMPRPAPPMTAPPAKAPARRLGVARVITTTTARMARYKQPKR